VTYNPKGFNIPENLPAVEGAFGLNFHQVAVYARDPMGVASLLSSLGFSTWSEDTATLTGRYLGLPCVIQAHMMFNYQMLPGKELEFVKYDEGHPNDIYQIRGTPFFSHVSAYVDNIEERCEEIFWKFNMLPAHRFETSNHTNPHVAGKKHFREALFELPAIGFNVKLIEKVIES
jgi:hypothetical protein